MPPDPLSMAPAVAGALAVLHASRQEGHKCLWFTKGKSLGLPILRKGMLSKFNSTPDNWSKVFRWWGRRPLCLSRKLPPSVNYYTACLCWRPGFCRHGVSVVRGLSIGCVIEQSQDLLAFKKAWNVRVCGPIGTSVTYSDIDQQCTRKMSALWGGGVNNVRIWLRITPKHDKRMRNDQNTVPNLIRVSAVLQKLSPNIMHVAMKW